MVHKLHHISMASPPRIGFLQLPGEVRNMIYRHLLHRKSAICMCNDGLQKTTSHPTQILRTCHFIYNEASTIYYGDNTFLYETGDTPSNAWRRWDLPPASINPRICSLMKNVRPVFDTEYHPGNLANTLLHSLLAPPSYETLAKSQSSPVRDGHTFGV